MGTWAASFFRRSEVPGKQVRVGLAAIHETTVRHPF
jgi:hypothetical protein